MKKIKAGDKMNYWEMKDRVNKLIDQVERQQARIVELESEGYEKSIIIASIKEIREYLRDKHTNPDQFPYFFTRLGAIQ